MRRRGEDCSLTRLCQEVSGVLNRVRIAFRYSPMKGVCRAAGDCARRTVDQGSAGAGGCRGVAPGVGGLRSGLDGSAERGSACRKASSIE